MIVNLKEFSIKLADKIAEFIGSWTFIIIQSTILTIWVIVNVIGLFNFDPYPFILLNLFLSFEAAYATPLILMSSSRQSDKDRQHLIHDLELDEEANIIIKKISEVLIEVKKDLDLDRMATRDHNKLKEDHLELKRDLEEIKRLLKNGGMSR
jgi:uncharacterized membrane protein